MKLNLLLKFICKKIELELNLIFRNQIKRKMNLLVFYKKF